MIDLNKKQILIIACALIVIGLALCSYSLLTNSNTKDVKNNTISYQGIIINIESSNIQVLKNNDDVFELIDHDTNTKYTYTVCAGDDSGTVAQNLIRETGGVAYNIGNGNYIVGYVTPLEGNDDENMDVTEYIHNATQGTLIDFNDLVDKV